MPRNWGYPGAGGEMRDGITPGLDLISYSYFSISEHNCKKIMAGRRSLKPVAAKPPFP